MKVVQVLLCLVAGTVGVKGIADKPREIKRIPKQINIKGIVLNDEEDRKAEGTDGFENFGGFDGGGGGGGGGGGKYFMYQHVPKKDHYEFGFKRGNEHHVKERHEKAHPHSGHFKTKVRWADKHGGHGEHYWDYNHHGHHGDGDDEGEDDEASARVNSYEPKDEDRTKRDRQSEDDVKWEQMSAKGTKARPKFEPASFQQDPSLIYNVEAKTVTDQNTGQIYVLYPIQGDIQ